MARQSFRAFLRCKYLPRCSSQLIFATIGVFLSLQCATAQHAHVHLDDPQKAREHLAMLDLGSQEKADCLALKSGQWSDASIWSKKKVPGAAARVFIPATVTVTYDIASDTEIDWIGVQGTFRYDPLKNTRLKVDTIVVTPEGTYEQGTPANPIGPNITSSVTFTDNGPIDIQKDPLLMSRGLVAHGSSMIWGTPRTRFLSVRDPVLTGATQVTLVSAPEGWQVGDEILLTATTWVSPEILGMDKSTRFQDERFTVAAVNGNTITLSGATQYDHISPGLDHRGNPSMYLVNFTNNIKYESANHDMSDEAVRRHGHVMFMHSEKVTVSYAQFDFLGRTNKKYEIDDTFSEVKTTAGGLMTPGTGTNVRGRYALHVHMTGKDLNSVPTLIHGVTVRHSPGWGIVNHHSHVNVEDSAVAFIGGAGFVEETGDGVGWFRRNIAVEVVGSGRPMELRDNHMLNDVCHHGGSFCFRGNEVKTEDCYAVNTYAGFVWINKQGEGAATIPASSLTHPSFANNRETVPYGEIPTTVFHDSTAVNAVNSVESGYWYTGTVSGGRTHLENLRLYNVYSGLAIPYTAQLTASNIVMTAKPYGGSWAITFGGTTGGDIVLNNIKASGFETSIGYLPTGHVFIVDNCDFSQNTNQGTPGSGVTVVHVPASSIVPGRFSYNVTRLQLPDSAIRTNATYMQITDSLGTKTVDENRPDEVGMFTTSGGDFQKLLAKGFYTHGSNQRYAMLKYAYMDRITGDIYPVNIEIPFTQSVVDEVKSNPSYAIGADRGEFQSERGTAVRQINAGGSAVGGYASDAGFSGTSTTESVPSGSFDRSIWNAAPQEVYSSIRRGPQFAYVIDGLTAGKKYTARLHFVENTYSKAGQRIFDVSINNETVLPRFDIIGDAGAQYHAVAKEIDAVADSAGHIRIDFAASTYSPDQNATIAAIEIVDDYGAVVTHSPYFSPLGGVFPSVQSVALGSDIPDADIFYTLDGTVPTTSSPRYSMPIDISNTTTIKAFAQAPGLLPSAIVTQPYTIIGPNDPVRYDLGSSTGTGTFAPDTLSPYSVGAGGGLFVPPYSQEDKSPIDVSAKNAGPVGIYATYLEQRWFGRVGFEVKNLWPAREYLVRLHFSEGTDTSRRRFDVNIEGNRVFDKFNLYELSGHQSHKAVVVDVPNVKANILGQIFVSLENVDPASDPDGNQNDAAAIISAIELFPSAVARPQSPLSLRLSDDN